MDPEGDVPRAPLDPPMVVKNSLLFIFLWENNRHNSYPFVGGGFIFSHGFMSLLAAPDDGYWHGGKYRFHIEVPEDYNIVVSDILFDLSHGFNVLLLLTVTQFGGDLFHFITPEISVAWPISIKY